MEKGIISTTDKITRINLHFLGEAIYKDCTLPETFVENFINDWNSYWVCKHGNIDGDFIEKFKKKDDEAWGFVYRSLSGYFNEIGAKFCWDNVPNRKKFYK